MRWLKTFESFESDIIKKIHDICEKYQWESTNLILKNQIKIGEYNGDDVVCFIVSSNTKGICVQAYYTTDEGKRRTEFILYEFEDAGRPKFMMDGTYEYFDEMDVGFSMYDDTIELILEELESCGEEWLTYQSELQQTGRDWHRKAIQNRVNDDDREEYTRIHNELSSIRKEQTIS